MLLSFLIYFPGYHNYVSCTHYEIVHKLSTSDNIYLLLYGTFCHQIKSSYKVNMYYPAVISEMKLHFNKNSPDIRLRNILDACFKFKTFGHYLQFCQTIRVYLTAKKATKHEKVGNCLTHATRRTRTRLLLLNLVACGSANTISHLDHINKQQCSQQRRYRTSNIPVNHNGVNTNYCVSRPRTFSKGGDYVRSYTQQVNINTPRTTTVH